MHWYPRGQANSSPLEPLSHTISTLRCFVKYNFQVDSNKKLAPRIFLGNHHKSVDASVLTYTIMFNLSQIWQRLKIYFQEKCLQEKEHTNMTFYRQNLNLETEKLQPREFQNRLQKYLQTWSQIGDGKEQIPLEIYDLLGSAVLKPKMLAAILEHLTHEDRFQPIKLFQHLQDFYLRWCGGEFIDAPPGYNLPQQQMLQLQAKNITLGLRQIDINTGLNVLILLLALHHYGQKHDHLSQEIIFYPSGQRDADNFFTSQLLRIINYSDTIEIGNFTSVVGAFLKGGNFSGAYLGDANLTGANFSTADLSTAYLGNANLTGVNFSFANLNNASVGDANLSGANLSGANLNRADLSSCNLSGAIATGADFSRGDLTHANLNTANLSNTDLSYADLSGADLRNADLRGANLSHAILFGANLSDAQLGDANLSGTDLCRADLSGADLSHTTLHNSNLSDTILFSANLSEASLSAVDLSYAKLHSAKLHGANLEGAIMMGADLSNVDLSAVILNQADLSGVILNQANLSEADLSDAILFGTDLSYANLSGSNLSGSNLSGATLNGANLSGSNLSYAILGGADLTDANLAQMVWNENLEWDGVRGLETAVNLPDALKVHLKLTNFGG